MVTSNTINNIFTVPASDGALPRLRSLMSGDLSRGARRNTIGFSSLPHDANGSLHPHDATADSNDSTIASLRARLFGGPPKRSGHNPAPPLSGVEWVDTLNAAAPLATMDAARASQPGVIHHAILMSKLLPCAGQLVRDAAVKCAESVDEAVQIVFAHEEARIDDDDLSAAYVASVIEAFLSSQNSIARRVSSDVLIAADTLWAPAGAVASTSKVGREHIVDGDDKSHGHAGASAIDDEGENSPLATAKHDAESDHHEAHSLAIGSTVKVPSEKLKVSPEKLRTRTRFAPGALVGPIAEHVYDAVVNDDMPLQHLQRALVGLAIRRAAKRAIAETESSRCDEMSAQVHEELESKAYSAAIAVVADGTSLAQAAVAESHRMQRRAPFIRGAAIAGGTALSGAALTVGALFAGPLMLLATGIAVGMGVTTATYGAFEAPEHLTFRHLSKANAKSMAISFVTAGVGAGLPIVAAVGSQLEGVKAATAALTSMMQATPACIVSAGHAAIQFGVETMKNAPEPLRVALNAAGTLLSPDRAASTAVVGASGAVAADIVNGTTPTMRHVAMGATGALVSSLTTTATVSGVHSAASGALEQHGAMDALKVGVDAAAGGLGGAAGGVAATMTANTLAGEKITSNIGRRALTSGLVGVGSGVGSSLKEAQDAAAAEVTDHPASNHVRVIL